MPKRADDHHFGGALLVPARLQSGVSGNSERFR
jgi:hypothetical protein